MYCTLQYMQQTNWSVKKKVKLQDSRTLFKVIDNKIHHTSPQAIKDILKWLYLQEIPPMWFKAQNQNLIQHFVLINIQVEECLFKTMLQQKKLKFLYGLITEDNKVEFLDGPIIESDYKSIFCSDRPTKTKFKSMNLQEKIIEKYKHNKLTPLQLSKNNYPNLNQKIYQEYQPTVLLPQAPYQNQILCMDCEMVSTDIGLELARVSIVNFQFQKIYDKYCKPKNKIINYNTKFSGITEQTLRHVKQTLEDIQKDLINLISSQAILIGHSLENDLKALKIVHYNIIDTSLLYLLGGRKQSLKFLAHTYLKNSIQKNSHDSIEDSINALALAKLKIEILDELQPTQTYDILEAIISNKNSILILDQSSYKFLSYGIHCQQVDNKDPILVVSKKLSNYMSSDRLVPKCIITKFKYNQFNEKSWENYYVCLDNQLEKIYCRASKNALFLFNFQINRKIRVLVNDSKYRKCNPFGIFLVK